MSVERETAYHEAGHAVAAHFLGIGIVKASIVPHDDTLGCITRRPTRTNWEERLTVAGYESSYGGFIDGCTRRWVEEQVMLALAGAHAQEHAVPGTDVDAAMGITMIPDDLAAKLTVDGPVCWMDGDAARANHLVAQVSGSDDEASAYLEWLNRRTRNLLCLPAYWPAVEALAAALMEHKTLTGRQVRELIYGAAIE